MSSILEKLNELDHKQTDNNEMNDDNNNVNNEMNDSNNMITNTEREEIKQKKSFRLMVDYIKNNKTDIPEEFRGNVMFDDDNLSLAAYWVSIMKNAPVPTWMRHDPNIVDKHGWTIAQHYIVCNKTDIIPEWMIHNPKIQNINGRTTAMMSLLYRSSERENEDLPTWMLHDVNVFDELGYSLVDYWLSCNSNDLPNWILDQIDDKKYWINKLGENIAISYLIRHRKLPPEEFRLSEAEGEEFRTVKGNTYNDLWNYFQSYFNL